MLWETPFRTSGQGSPSSMSRTPLKILVAAVVAAFAASAAAPADGAPRKPRKCTPKMIYADWYDGQLETSWPVACIRAAIRNAPDDVMTYGDLPQDLQIALEKAIRANKRGGSRPAERGPGAGGGDDPGGQSAPSSGGGSSSSGGSTPPAAGPDTPTSSPTIEEPRSSSAGERTLASDRTENDGLFEKAANKLGPGTADSVPLPLILLAGMALILLATAAASVVARRVQARRVRVVETRPSAPPEG